MAGDAPDVSEEQPGFSAGDGFLPILCQAAASTQPGKGALDHPPSGQDLEALRRVGAFDDLDGPSAEGL